MGPTKRPVALITGGSRGIGAAAATALAKRGDDIVITYRNKATRANEVVAELAQYNVRALAVGCDITQQADLDQLFATLKDWSGYLDLLILNAAGGLERDLVADTVMARLLERTVPGLSEERRDKIGQLPTTTEMGEAIAAAATDPTLPSGHTVVVGGALDALLSQ